MYHFPMECAILFVFVKSENGPSWDLVLEDPATVLECLRQGNKSVLAMARFLLDGGRALSTRSV